MIIPPSEVIKNQFISFFINKEVQTQQAGFDITVKEVHKILNAGKIDFENKEREISKTEKLNFNEDGWLFLNQGAYKIIINEIVKIPEDAAAICLTRSSLIRSGAMLITALWDPGYEGRSEMLLYVANKYGLYIKKNARIGQLVFLKIRGKVERYKGKYLKENL